MNREQRNMWIAIILCVFLTSGIITFRLLNLHRSHQQQIGNIWHVTCDITFLKTPSKAIVALPDNSPHIRIYQEMFTHQNLWMDISRNKTTQAREAIMIPTQKRSSMRFTADFALQVLPSVLAKPSRVKPSPSTQQLEKWLHDEPTLQINHASVTTLLEQLTQNAKDKVQLVTQIYDYCSDNLVTSTRDGAVDVPIVLYSRGGSALGRTRTMIALCRAAKIPARLVTGIQLQQQTRQDLNYWVEVYMKKTWYSFDPVNGFSRNLPVNMLAITRDHSHPVRLILPKEYRMTFMTYRASPLPYLIPTTIRRHWTNIFDLTRLDPGMQTVLMGLMLLPFGVLITAFFRNIIGIRTFGTFAPSLIALGLLQVNWTTAISVITSVLLVGFTVRWFLNHLKLLMVARLGVILTIMVLYMALAISLLDHYSLIPTASAVLLPMVIMAMLVERFYITAEEDNLHEAIWISIGTVTVASVCWFILGSSFLSRLVICFPEILLCVCGTLIFMGRYSGYRLNELWRFRDIRPIEA